MKDVKKLLLEKQHDFDSLVSVLKILRGENGCPWDREQTHKSVRKCLIEETYEVVEAIDNSDPVLLREELGDLLFQVMFHSQLEDEAGRFTINEVINDICAKMIHRHPHVFGSLSVDGSGEVIANWDSIKKEEKKQSSISDSLKSVPPYLPALMKAQKIQGKAKRKLNFGFKSDDEAISFASESLQNIDDNSISECIFALCAAAELRGIDLERELTVQCNRFIASAECCENNKIN